MTRSRRVLIALLTAVAMFFATTASHGLAAASGERSIRRAPPIAHAIVALRVASAAAKARAADPHDALPFVALPPPSLLAIAAAVLADRAAIAASIPLFLDASDIPSRARAPPIG